MFQHNLQFGLEFSVELVLGVVGLDLFVEAGGVDHGAALAD